MKLKTGVSLPFCNRLAKRAAHQSIPVVQSYCSESLLQTTLGHVKTLVPNSDSTLHLKKVSRVSKAKGIRTTSQSAQWNACLITCRFPSIEL